MTDRARGAVARDVLAANQAFYRAFAARDMTAMEAIWATGVQVACIHPGWNALRGRDLVIASWRSILGSESAPEVMYGNASAHLLGESAFVICEEQVAEDVLIATNVFVREGGGWRLAHHQAAPIAPDSLQITRSEDEDSGVLN
ncbi:MAG: nuclear transport factor 2 family protein [Pseudomonadota bacterium]